MTLPFSLFRLFQPQKTLIAYLHLSSGCSHEWDSVYLRPPLRTSFAITITTIENRLLRIDSVCAAKRDAAPGAPLVCRPLVGVHGRYIRGTLRQRYKGQVCLRVDNLLLRMFLVPACGSFQDASEMENGLEAARIALPWHPQENIGGEALRRNNQNP